MGALLDAMGAVVIGSIVLITIMTSIMNFQQLNYNILTLTNLTDISEYYMANVEDVVLATPRHFSFHAYLDGTQLDLIEIIIDNQKEGIGYPLKVKITEPDSSVRWDAGSYIITDTLVFTYYDRQMIETTAPDSVANLKMELTFVSKGWKEDESETIRYFMTIWKSLKKIYLK